ncbi:hypothetical protein OG976_23340 [Mycobacterium sp. NBC_00419]|uniref:hypothetical protein n=1 Tax=Mycobacterium sp. NBC_00419 TaxID=2975989 RepID=UPI002E1E7168
MASYASAAPQASGGTGIAAGVLALLIAVYRGWVTYAYLATADALSQMSVGSGWAKDSRNMALAAGIVSAVGTLALLGGAIKLLNRGLGGRGLITVGCLIAIADVVITWALIWGWFTTSFGGMSMGSSWDSMFTRQGPTIVLNLALTVGVPLLTMILALAAATRRWCEAARAPAVYGSPTY